MEKQAAKSMNPNAPKVAVFNDSFVTLAEVLRTGGYATSAFVANPFVLSEFGFGQGFDHFDAGFAENTTPGSTVNDAALAWLSSRDKNKPFFCFLHYMDVHGPYNAGTGFLDPILDKVEAMPIKRKLSSSELKNLSYLFRPPGVHTNIDRHKRLMTYLEYWWPVTTHGFERSTTTLDS